ncbi:hypothetical protein BGZ98_008114 [Dissophora globulifera]|nr:hypothetical protein BGZ98_008114 [Dissophora globulifera]
MERVASTGSLKRPTSIRATSSLGLASPTASLSASHLPLPDEVFSNNPQDYDIQQPIGYGSSAVVYNAFYKPLNKRVAIKVIDLDMFERNQIDELRRETQVMALCKHPNVLRVNGAFVADSKLYIVTPYLSAGSCLDIMKCAYPDGFDEISIATILKQALQGLDYLHKNGHIHRQVHQILILDVKAGNLLMDDDGSVLLADFGVSSSLMETGDRRGMRKTFVGTPCWMAPEVMEQAGYDYKADIWSFGITAIELATGHAPFAKYPPIKVLMLTLSNDSPTLDRESTKHRYTKMLKEMIDSCLQKDPSRRPSAEKLLNHPFFKQAKKRSHLVTTLLHNIPLLEQRPLRRAEKKQVFPEKGVSWNFDADDASTPSKVETQGAEEDATRRPRTVTFDAPPARPSSTLRTESMPSPKTAAMPIMENRMIDLLSEDAASSRGSTPQSSQTGDRPARKSRFVVEDSSAVLSPTVSLTTDALPSPQSIHPPVQLPSVQLPSVQLPSVQLPQTQLPPTQLPPALNLQGLGVSQGTLEAGAQPEVRKGRFSVKDTSLGGASPTSSSTKMMLPDVPMPPLRSMSSSPVEGTADGVRIGTIPMEQTPSSERKSRFEVQHTHSTPVTSVSTLSNGTGTNTPTVATSQGTPLSRESSQSRPAGSEAGLARDNSTTRISRFSVEPTHVGHSEMSTAPSSATISSTGTPNPANGLVSTPSKRSRFQVSSVETGRSGGDISSADTGGSGHSTPTTSPTGSLLRGQPALLEALGAQTMYHQLDILYRQNEQQRAILTELLTGFGLKTGLGASIKTVQGEVAAMLLGGSGTVGSVHRQEPVTAQMTTERQLQVSLRENESLRRENDALKRELDRLRRGGQ